MIAKEDLRVGNIVCGMSSNGPEEPIAPRYDVPRIVWEIFSDHVLARKLTDPVPHGATKITYEYLAGFPITEPRLRRFGFQACGNLQFKKDWVTIELRADGWFPNTREPNLHGLRLMFIHNLQNFYKEVTRANLVLMSVV